MRGFWVILSLVSAILWFANPFAFAWVSQIGLLIEAARGITPILLICSFIIAYATDRKIFALFSFLFLFLTCTKLPYLVQPAMKVTSETLKSFCSNNIQNGSLLTPSSEPHVKAEVWEREGMIIGRVCISEEMNSSLFWELYRSTRRLSSLIRHRTEPKIIVTDVPLPELARIYAILEEVSQTDRKGILDFSFQSFIFGTPHLFTSVLTQDQQEIATRYLMNN